MVSGDAANGVAHQDGDAVGGARSQTSRFGRKRDHSRDADILDATLDVLAEVGYLGMTVDMVVARARAGKATVYRRWPSKDDLISEAVARMKRSQVDLDQLPDTGTLRADLLGLFKPESIDESVRKLKVMAGLASMMQNRPALAEAASDAITEPWAAANRALIQRAVDRGEIAATADIETLCHVVPSMAAYRSLVQQKAFDLAFLVSMIDGVLLPALGVTRAADRPSNQHL
jgi:AcrR family transcriptional regulator